MSRIKVEPYEAAEMGAAGISGMDPARVRERKRKGMEMEAGEQVQEEAAGGSNNTSEEVPAVQNKKRRGRKSTLERKYACEICGADYTSKYVLQKHIREKHNTCS